MASTRPAARPAIRSSQAAARARPAMNRNRGGPPSWPRERRTRSTPLTPATVVSQMTMSGAIVWESATAASAVAACDTCSPSSPAAARSTCASTRRLHDKRTPAPRLGERSRLGCVPAASAESARPTGESTSDSVPPCDDAMPSEIERPRPVPSPTSRVVKNGSKIRPRSSGLIPGPLSVTSTVCIDGPPRSRR